MKVAATRSVATTRIVKIKKDTNPRAPTTDTSSYNADPVNANSTSNTTDGKSYTSESSYFPSTEQFDSPIEEPEESHNWSTSFHGLSTQPFPAEVADILLQPVNPEDVEIKPDGLIYLPEIKYRRILNKAFGPGGWGLAPRGEHSISAKNISREYALVCHGRFVSQARGEQDFFDITGLPTASEGCKSNALMRCCKDLGVASELWDPVFIRKFKKKYCVEVWAEHVLTKKKKKLWRKKDESLEYPYKETGMA
ncbi:hypothetical protein EC973_005430 [Apophysomyces ossiformis]|uniref:Mitochondrial genome maintenance protein MGM101 n=1 Tax=Apophysomyces ossiformis TaxID=679940 RepID=A0A8H7BUB9_9FUNG|nr:hypothetical protein EC973_005430 [Apophysomyces ossiformis]